LRLLSPKAERGAGQRFSRKDDVPTLNQRRAAQETGQSPREGFTLIELLVVIAIIAILAALLLPVLSHAKVAANNVVCMNNLRQQELGLSMYAEDTGFYPPYSSISSAGGAVLDRGAGHLPPLWHPDE
jgi:prepilin-type N-terminal cleavage/methylation domain-containing protein